MVVYCILHVHDRRVLTKHGSDVTRNKLPISSAAAGLVLRSSAQQNLIFLSIIGVLVVQQPAAGGHKIHFSYFGTKKNARQQKGEGAKLTEKKKHKGKTLARRTPPLACQRHDPDPHRQPCSRQKQKPAPCASLTRKNLPPQIANPGSEGGQDNDHNKTRQKSKQN